MSLAKRWAPALLALSLPAAAAPFCACEAEGFQFSNRGAAWKLALRDDRSGAMTLVYGRNHVTVDYVRGKGFDLTYAIGSLAGMEHLPYPDQGDHTASERRMAELAQALVRQVQGDYPDEWQGFDAQMGRFIDTLVLEGQIFRLQDAAQGDRYRGAAVADYWTHARRRCLLGTLHQVKRMLDTYLEARSHGAPGWPSMNWEGVVAAPTVTLGPGPAQVRLEAADAKGTEPAVPSAAAPAEAAPAPAAASSAPRQPAGAASQGKPVQPAPGKPGVESKGQPAGGGRVFGTRLTDQDVNRRQ